MIDELPDLPWQVNDWGERYLDAETFIVECGFMLFLNGVLSSLGFAVCAVYAEPECETFQGFDIRGTGHDPLPIRSDPWQNQAQRRIQIVLRPKVEPELR